MPNVRSIRPRHPRDQQDAVRQDARRHRGLGGPGGELAGERADDARAPIMMHCGQGSGLTLKTCRAVCASRAARGLSSRQTHVSGCLPT